jgi:general stress protein YciG
MPNQNTTKEISRNGQTDGTPRRRGFAAMDPKLVRDLARKGGVAAHKAGTAHEFSSEEARVAGRKGGLATHGARTDGSPSSSDNKPS